MSDPIILCGHIYASVILPYWSFGQSLSIQEASDMWSRIPRYCAFSRVYTRRMNTFKWHVKIVICLLNLVYVVYVKSVSLAYFLLSHKKVKRTQFSIKVTKMTSHEFFFGMFILPDTNIFTPVSRGVMAFWLVNQSSFITFCLSYGPDSNIGP